MNSTAAAIHHHIEIQYDRVLVVGLVLRVSQAPRTTATNHRSHYYLSHSGTRTPLLLLVLPYRLVLSLFLFVVTLLHDCFPQITYRDGNDVGIGDCPAEYCYRYWAVGSIPRTWQLKGP